MSTRSTGARRRPKRALAVIFDLDGTLLDSLGVIPAVYVRSIRMLGGPPISQEALLQVWGIGPTATVLQHFLGRPCTKADLDVFFSEYERAMAVVRPFPTVPLMLETLARHALELGVFTLSTSRAARVALDGSGLAQHFTVVVGGDEVQHAKPAPDGLLLACSRLGVSPAQAVYVGDRPDDLLCAAVAGALGIHALWGSDGGSEPGEHASALTPEDVVRIVVPDGS